MYFETGVHLQHSGLSFFKASFESLIISINCRYEYKINRFEFSNSSVVEAIAETIAYVLNCKFVIMQRTYFINYITTMK